jgi:predicted transposase YbfD/YdcC
MDYTNLRPNEDVDQNGLIFDMDSLYATLNKIPDTRQRRGKRYPLPTLLMLIVLAKMGGEDKPNGIAEWIANRATQLNEMGILPRERAPSHMTYRRVLQEVIDPQEFEQVVGQFHQSRLKKQHNIVFSMDGKTLRGTIPNGEMRGTHLLAIYQPQQGLVLAEAQVESKENEIVIAPKILKQIHLEGAVVIADAMHTQRTVSAQIVEAGGNYIWTAKENQPRTHWAIQKLFVHEVCNLRQGCALNKDFQMTVCVNKNRGRLEKRTLTVSSLLNEYLDWPHVAQVFRLEKTIWHPRHKGQTREITYGLTSLPADKASPDKLLSLLRQYWGIEAGLHFRRDVTLHEDATRMTVGKSGHNMAILNNLIIGLCLHSGHQNLAKARRLFCAQPKKALDLILSAFPTL